MVTKNALDGDIIDKKKRGCTNKMEVLKSTAKTTMNCTVL